MEGGRVDEERCDGKRIRKTIERAGGSRKGTSGTTEDRPIEIEKASIITSNIIVDEGKGKNWKALERKMPENTTIIGDPKD